MKVIYAIVNLKNGKKYIGSATNFSSRRSRHLSMLKKGIHHSQSLQHSWNKNNPEDYKFIILEKLTQEEDKLVKEQYYMDYYKSYNRKFGYNMSKTARGATSVKTKPVNQFSLDGTFIKSFDNCVSAANEVNYSCSGISACARGEYRYYGGYIWSHDEAISEERIYLANNPIKRSIESRAKMSASATARTDQRKPILQFDMDGNFIREWRCTSDASKELGYSNGGISDVLHGKFRHCHKFIWKFKNEQNE